MSPEWDARQAGLVYTQVHFTVLPGSLERNRHLIGRALA